MIIDFHAHIFPDELAERAISSLTEADHGLSTPVTDGTESGLLKRMDEWGIDISVVQPVITKQSQTRKTNLWCAGLRSNRIIAFGGIWPHTDDYRRDIDFVADLGLKGLKFHPEYQEYVVDDRRILKIYDYALSKGLILMIHAGAIEAYSPPYKSSPRQMANIADSMRGGVIIAAHLGGHLQWDEVESYLVGKELYLETSMGFDFYTREQFLRIAAGHGTDKILFGSDSPWSNAKKEIVALQSLPLTPREKEGILGLNAKRILGL